MVSLGTGARSPLILCLSTRVISLETELVYLTSHELWMLGLLFLKEDLTLCPWLARSSLWTSCFRTHRDSSASTFWVPG